MGQALYRKHRPKKLAEIVGQEPITTALDNALKQGKISHAYLFTGPRGVGKTSIARILAHEINNLPYDETATHLDIIEIDAASNRRIDEIRDLRERVHTAPANAKYKVYIIDEVHMLTREAFNALLKTLEEPPEHAIFILATTEAHKLPETIVSRTQRYTFRPIDKQKVVEHLRSIAKAEKIDVTDEALELIAEHGDGSFRDSISLLDQVRNSDKKVTLETVQGSLGIAPASTVQNLVKAVVAHDSQTLLSELHAMTQHGYHAPQIAKQLAEVIRTGMMSGLSQLPAAQSTQLLRALLEVPAAHDPGRLLEIILLEATLSGGESGQLPEAAPIATQTSPSPTKIPEQPQQETSPALEIKPTPQPVVPEAREDKSDEASPITAPEKMTVRPTAQETPKKKSGKTALDEAQWQEVLQAIKARHNTLYSVARMAVPRFEGSDLILIFSFPFHQKRLNEPKNKQVINDIILQQTGHTVTITCEVDVNARSLPAAITQPAAVDPSLENISNIFGGGEVLE